MALSGKYIKGIEIEIGGNATKLKTALDTANKSIKTTQTELDTLRNNLKLEWNPDSFRRAQELAQRTVQQTTEKAEMLRKALAEVEKQGGSKNTEQYEAIRRELSYVQVAAQKARTELSDLNRLQFSELENSAKRLQQEIENSKGIISATQAELEMLKSSLNTNWDANVFQQAQKLAQQSVEETAQYVGRLKARMQQLQDAGIQDEHIVEYQKLRKELAEAERAAKAAGEQIQAINRIKLDSFKSAFTEASANLNNIGNKLTMGLTAPLVAGGAAAVNYASDTAEAVNKVETAFTYAAEGVKKWSDTTLTSIGLAKGTALDMAALFGDMATSMGFNAAEAADMSKRMVELAADLASFKNVKIDVANTALKSVFTGETESLKGLGVVMTEANLKAYALAEGFSKSYDSMSQSEKVALRYQYVLEQTQNAQGDFARTFDGTANQLRICQESLKELAATAGDELLPVVTPMIAQINALLQAFGDLDEGTRGLIVQTLLFTATLGPMLKLTGAGTKIVEASITAYTALRTALQAKQAADAAATASQTALNATMAANPAGMLVTAIGALVAVLGSFALTAALTAEKTGALNDKLRESREAYEENAAALESQNADTLAMVSALEGLAEKTGRTAAEQETMLSLVEQLNEAVPGLSLAYDEQTGCLVDLETGAAMTAEAIRELARAEAERQSQAADIDRLAELYIEEKSVLNELAAAEDALAAAVGRKTQMLEDGTYGTMGYEMATADADAAVASAKKTVDALSSALEDNAAEAGNLSNKYAAQADSTNTASASLVQYSGAAADAAGRAAATAEELEELAAAAGRHTEQTRALISETDALSAALKEQGENGNLSLDTALELIDAGYAAAVSIDTETGAVRLNTAAYQEIAKAKLDEQIAELESQRLRVNATLELRWEAAAALDTAAAYVELGKAKGQEQAMGSDAGVSTGELEAQLKALDAQLATLNALRDAIGKAAFGSYGGSAKRGSSKAGKSAADAMVDAYKEALKELEYLRDMGEIDEAAYYKRLEALRDKYLKENSDQWRSVTVKLHDWRKKQAEDMAKAQKAAYDEKLADLKYFLNMDLITEQEYYRQMAELRDAYLQEDSAAWRSANEELYRYQKEQAQARLDALKEELEARKDAIEDWYGQEQDSLKARYSQQKEEAKAAYEAARDEAKKAYTDEKAAAKEAYEAKKAQIKAGLALEKERLNAIIDGIDAEIQARRELREDQQQEDAVAAAQKRLDAAKAQLAFARTDEDRAEWGKEILRLEEALADAIRDREDTAFYREKELEKEAVQEQIAHAEKQADAALTAAEADYRAKTAQLETDYQAKAAQLEADYQAKAAQLEAEYSAAQEALKRDYQNRLDEAERAYQKALKEEQESSSSGGGGSRDGFGGDGDPGDYVTNWDEISGGGGGGSSGGGGHSGGITVDDIINAGSGGYGPDGLHFNDSFLASRAATAAMASAVGAAVGAAAGTVNQISRTNNAHVTINQASSLTEGQISGAVQKALDRLSK